MHVRRALLSGVLLIFWGAGKLCAQTWDGGGANDRWNTKNNWNPNTTPSFNNSTDLIFTGSTRTSPDMNGNRIVNSITFNSSASSFTLLGDNGGSETLTFNGTGAALVQSSANDQTLLMNRIRFNANTTITVTGAGDFYIGDGTATAGLFYGASDLTKTGTGGALILSANNSNWSGDLAINAGVVEARANNALGNTSGVTTIASGASLNIGAGGLAIGESLTLSGTGITNTGALRNITGSNSVSGAIILGAAARINADTGTLTLSGGITGAGQSLTLGGTGNITVSGVIGTTTGTLTKDGAGTAILSATNTYSGSTTVSAGTLQIGDAGTSGTFGSGGGVTNNAAITLNRTDAFTVANAISGTGTLTQVGSGTTTLTGANSYSGATTITAGALNLQNDTALGTTAGGTSVNSGAALELQGGISVGAEALTLNGTGVSGTGAIRNVLGSNNYTGQITLGSAALVTANTGSTLNLSGGTTGANQDLTAGTAAQNGNIIISGAISNGTGQLTKAGSGDLTFGKSTGITGTVGKTHLNAGTLTVGLDSGTQSVLNTAELDSALGTTLKIGSAGKVVANYASGNTNMFGTIDEVSASGGTFEKTGAGTLTFNTSFNFAGNLILSGGTLALANSASVTFGNIYITANMTIDFGSGTSTILSSANLFIAAGVQVSVINWVNNGAGGSDDIWYATNAFNNYTGTPSSPTLGTSAVLDAIGAAPENQITFTGIAPAANTSWVGVQGGQYYDREIRPIPEPSTYGALFIGGCLACFGWRRFRRRATSRA
jgi:fibronectin-binding autotransporter adhesin